MVKRTLYVDCDDTLVLYHDTPGQMRGVHPYGAYDGIPWSPNQMLIALLQEWLTLDSDRHLVVWSGGGEEYAAMWAMKLLNSVDLESTTVSDKNTDPTGVVPGPQDFVIDDQELPFIRDVPVLTAEAFIELANEKGIDKI